MRKLRKGFTIVELIIVISVIAVLTAVLIPTFIHLSKKAKQSADKSLVATLNTALKIEEADSGKTPKTMHDAVLGLENQGYKLPQLVTKSGEDLVYHIETNQFYLESSAEELISERNSDDNPSNNLSYHDFWHIESAMPTTEKWSIYAHQWTTAEVENLTVGFDAGYAGQTTVTSIAYAREGSASDHRSVIIRTISAHTTLSINAPYDTVAHYETVGKVDIANIDMNCYNEYGKASYVKVAEGKIVAKAGGTISIAFAANTDGSKVAVIEETQGTIETGYTTQQPTHDANIAREGGIELVYSITGISPADLEEYIVSKGEEEVELAQAVEDPIIANSDGETTSNPTGIFADPFIIEEGTIGGDIATLGFNEEFDLEDEDNFTDEELYEFINYTWWDAEDATWTSSNPDVAYLDEGDWSGYTLFTGEEEGTAIITFITGGEEMELLVKVVSSVKYFKVGSEYYTNLHDASTAAPQGTTIELLEDYQGDSALVVEGAVYNDRVFQYNKTLTLDLNGHTIKGEESYYGTYAFAVWDCNLTITDSSTSKTGKISGTVSCKCMGGFTTYNPVTGEGIFDRWDVSNDTTVKFKAGTIKNIQVKDYVTVEIDGATVINVDSNGAAINYSSTDWDSLENVKILVKSGTIVGRAKAIDTTHLPVGSITITGGYFSHKVNEVALAKDGYRYVDNGDGLWRVVKK